MKQSLFLVIILNFASCFNTYTTLADKYADIILSKTDHELSGDKLKKANLFCVHTQTACTVLTGITGFLTFTGVLITCTHILNKKPKPTKILVASTGTIALGLLAAGSHFVKQIAASLEKKTSSRITYNIFKNRAK